MGRQTRTAEKQGQKMLGSLLADMGSFLAGAPLVPVFVFGQTDATKSAD